MEFMKIIMVLILSLLIWTSCTKKKSYKYVEVVDEVGLFGENHSRE